MNLSKKQVINLSLAAEIPETINGIPYEQVDETERKKLLLKERLKNALWLYYYITLN